MARSAILESTRSRIDSCPVGTFEIRSVDTTLGKGDMVNECDRFTGSNIEDVPAAATLETEDNIEVSTNVVLAIVRIPTKSVL